VGILGFNSFGALPIVHRGAFLSAELLRLSVIVLWALYSSGPGIRFFSPISVLFVFPIVALEPLLKWLTLLVS
jgi:hypothetical protein